MWEVKVSKYYSQEAYHDDVGYDITYTADGEWEAKDAKKEVERIVQWYTQYLESFGNGSNPAAGIAWSNRVHTEDIANGVRVYKSHPIGD